MNAPQPPKNFLQISFYFISLFNRISEELRGFESRCCRLQSSLDRVQNDRLVFLKNIGSIINVGEPCESLIKDKVREIMNENQTMHNVSMRTTIHANLVVSTIIR